MGISDKLSGKTLSFGENDGFQVILSESPLPNLRTLKAGDLRVVGKPRLENLKSDLRVTRLAGRCEGKQITVDLASPDGNLGVQWQAILRDGSNYVASESLSRPTGSRWKSSKSCCWRWPPRGPRVAGTVDGTPVVAGDMFFACEHPMATSEILAAGGSRVSERRDHVPAADASQKRFRCSYSVNGLVRPGRPLAYTAVVGVAPEGQLRRGFLYYLERERAQPYRPFCTTTTARRSAASTGKGSSTESGRRGREVPPQPGASLAGEHPGVRRGAGGEAQGGHGLVRPRLRVGRRERWSGSSTKAIRKASPRHSEPAAQYGARVGVWLSPSGRLPGQARPDRAGPQTGFRDERQRPVAGRPAILRPGPHRLRQHDPRVRRQLFQVRRLRRPATTRPERAQYRSDVEALLRMMTELRALEPDVFFNPLTGTWPSPFWLRYADSIWRQGSDTSVLGKGSDRQQWITYRDGEIYHGVLDKAPLYPVNSLMIHGIFVNALPLFGNPYDPASSAPDVRSRRRSSPRSARFSAPGPNLQEMYIAPKLMTPRDLGRPGRGGAMVARECPTCWWTRTGSGGDPAKGQVYGWASWSKRKGDPHAPQSRRAAGRDHARPGQGLRAAQAGRRAVRAEEPLEGGREKARPGVVREPTPHVRPAAV